VHVFVRIAPVFGHVFWAHKRVDPIERREGMRERVVYSMSVSPYICPRHLQVLAAAPRAQTMGTHKQVPAALLTRVFNTR
jgi:hypothetical protein